MTINCFILEDQAPARLMVEDFVSKLHDLEMMGSSANASIAKSMLKSADIDLLFLDLNISGQDGFELLRALETPPIVIVTTAYPKRALEGFEAGVADYLVKPFSFQRFETAVDRARALITSKRDVPARLELQTQRGKFEYIDQDKVLAISADGDYVIIQTRFQDYHVLGPLSKWAEQLPKHSFAQIHRSHIVNRKRLTDRDAGHVFIEDRQYPIGDKYKGNLKDYE